MSAKHLEAALADLRLSYSQSLAKAKQAIGRIVSKTLFVLLWLESLCVLLHVLQGPRAKPNRRKPSAVSAYLSILEMLAPMAGSAAAFATQIEEHVLYKAKLQVSPVQVPGLRCPVYCIFKCFLERLILQTHRPKQ